MSDTEPSEPPCASEILAAWEGMSDAVQDYRRAPYDTMERIRAEERLERKFTAFARLLNRVPRGES